MKYEYLKDLTSDVAFKAYGQNLKEVFENSAEALLSIMCDVEKIKPKDKIIIMAEGDDRKDLLFNWLQQLIAHVEIEQMFFSKFKITKITGTKLTAECYGEPINMGKAGTLVKSLTNYLFNLEEKEGEYTATISVDI